MSKYLSLFKCVCGSDPAAHIGFKESRLYCPICGSCTGVYKSIWLSIMEWNLLNSDFGKEYKCKLNST